MTNTSETGTLPFAKATYTFPGQRKDEKVLYVIRRHSILLLTPWLILSLLAIAPPLVYFFLIPIEMPELGTPALRPLWALGYTIYFGFLWISAFLAWMDYYLDVWIITPERLIDIEQKGPFSRTVSEVDLRRIQDISSSTHGLLATFFGLGDIHLQTAAEASKFTMESIPSPVRTRRSIMDLVHQAQERGGILD